VTVEPLFIAAEGSMNKNVNMQNRELECSCVKLFLI